MRMKMVCDDRTLREISNEFLALKKAQKIRDRTLSDYRKYIDKFLAQSENSLDVAQGTVLCALRYKPFNDDPSYLLTKGYTI